MAGRKNAAHWYPKEIVIGKLMKPINKCLVIICKDILSFWLFVLSLIICKTMRFICTISAEVKVPMTRNFNPKGLWLHCKDHLKWLNNFFYRILVIFSLFKIFNFVSYANITGVTSHHVMSFQKSIVFLTNTYLKNLKIALVYVLIS
jgi:membrane protein YqaA with SNARE-associated domain